MKSNVGSAFLWLAVAMFFLNGCASTMNTQCASTVNTQSDSSVLRRAVIVGLTKVDRSAYGGWDGDCPGCDVDSSVMAMLCKEQGLEIKQLNNEHATISSTSEAVRWAYAGMKAGDLIVVYVSGHGGQVQDVNGDEPDRLDETLVLWDGEMTDDMASKLWEEMPAGVRVLYITDTCNSGSNFKGRIKSAKRMIPRNYKGALIHYGGCADGKSSIGSASGGAFTTALIDAWDSSSNYQSWFERASKLMNNGQVPVYAEYGAVTDEFRSTTVLR